MGLDVNLYAEGEVSDDELSTADQFVMTRSVIAGGYGRTEMNALARADEDWFDAPRIEFLTSSRYYGQGYERGDWPAIYGAIRLMQAALPDCRIFYGSDSSDEGIECTEEYLAEMWAHFLGPHGDNYRQEVRRWNEART